MKGVRDARVSVNISFLHPATKQSREDIHIKFGEDSTLTQESFIEQALVSQGIEPADLYVRWGDACEVCQ